MPGFENPIKTESFATFVKNLFSILTEVAGAALIIVLVYAGYLFSTAQGDPEKVRRAKNAIFWSVVGAGVIFLGKYIAEAIIKAIP